MGIRRGQPPVTPPATTQRMQRRSPVRGDKVHPEAVGLDKTTTADLAPDLVPQRHGASFAL